MLWQCQKTAPEAGHRVCQHAVRHPSFLVGSLSLGSRAVRLRATSSSTAIESVSDMCKPMLSRLCRPLLCSWQVMSTGMADQLQTPSIISLSPCRMLHGQPFRCESCCMDSAPSVQCHQDRSGGPCSYHLHEWHYGSCCQIMLHLDLCCITPRDPQNWCVLPSILLVFRHPAEGIPGA